MFTSHARSALYSKTLVCANQFVGLDLARTSWSDRSPLTRKMWLHNGRNASSRATNQCACSRAPASGILGAGTRWSGIRRTVHIAVETVRIPVASSMRRTAGSDCIFTQADETITSAPAVFKRFTSFSNCNGFRLPTSRLSGISNQIASTTSMPLELDVLDDEVGQPLHIRRHQRDAACTQHLQSVQERRQTSLPGPGNDWLARPVSIDVRSCGDSRGPWTRL